MANIILETKIKNLSPILWYGQNVVDKYIAIVKMLSAKIGPEYAMLFTQPQLSESSIKGLSTARWLSNHISSNAKKLTDLDQATYLVAKQLFQERLDKVSGFGNKLLLSEKDENVRWGQLILKAINYPDESHVYYENGKVAITAWGFKLDDPSIAVKGYTREVITEKEVPLVPNPAIQKEESTEDKIEPPHPVNSGEDSSNLLEESEESSDLKENKITKANEELDSKEVATKVTTNEKEFFLKKYWWLPLFLLLLLGIYFLYYIYKPRIAPTVDPSSPGVGEVIKPIAPPVNSPSPEIGEVIKPIDPVTIIRSPDSITSIVADRLNVALHGQNKDIEAFCKDFKKLYPSSDYSIIYKEPKTARIQIQVPNAALASLKKSLESKMSGYNLLIWHESIFQKNKQFNDPGFLDKKKSWYFDEVQAKEAWDITQGADDIIIAILDSGFDVNHPELKDKLYKPWDVTTRSGTIAYHKEHSVHGTHVASISAANANNKSGVSGIAPNCKIMPVKVGDNNGILSSTYIIDGFLYALNSGADVINMSLGLEVHPSVEKLPESAQKELIRNSFKDEEAFWELLFDIALNNNTAVVLAGGNQNILIGVDPLDRSNYPIRVSATNIKGSKAEFSNWGDYSDVSAPGDNIYNATGNSSYNYLSGTSMAAPIVTGAVALLKSVKKELKPSDLKHILKSTGKAAFAPTNRRIGNIIQIKDALLYAKTGKLPEINCTDVQAKIDSLNREIERLKLECSRNINYDTLQFPKIFPKTPEFAKGRWKSTSPLINMSSKEPIELYFDFQNNKEGKLTLVEKNGTICHAKLKINLSNAQLVFDQTEIANCDDNSKYNRYLFSCKADKNGTAICAAKNKSTSNNDVEFLLVKIK